MRMWHSRPRLCFDFGQSNGARKKSESRDVAMPRLNVKNMVWETVRVASPYRKLYIYVCPHEERKAKMPQMFSVYLLMFVLGSVTRYFPGYFEELLESKYGPFFKTFISESPMQFLYLMASDMLGQEVSKPAII